MSRDDMKRSRALKGAASAEDSPKRFAPLRKVVSDTGEIEQLECGHEIRAPHDLIGRTYAARRRCLECLQATCGENGHPLDVERGVRPSCRCGAADGAMAHLQGWHDMTDAPTPGDLVAARELHRQRHDCEPSRRPHWHWTSATEWSARTRPEDR